MGFFLTGYSLFVLAVISFVLVSSSPSVPTKKDDAFHYTPGVKHDFWDTEWWYFNFQCPGGVSGIYVYGAWDIGNEYNIGRSILYALHYDSSEVFHITDLHTVKDFSASYEEADVTILDNTVRVLDSAGTQYQVIGESADKTASWNLTYNAQVDPWFFYANSSLGPGWQTLSWLVYMPRALVDGEVRFNGENHLISQCSGYHDHDWGIWDSFKMTWAWMNFNNENGIAFVAGAGRDSGKFNPANNLWFKYDDLMLKFTPDECVVDFTDFVKSDIPLHKYPAHVHYECQSETHHIDINYDVLMSPGIVKSAIFIFEQKSAFQGILKDANEEVIVQFDGLGWSEWAEPIL